MDGIGQQKSHKKERNETNMAAAAAAAAADYYLYYNTTDTACDSFVQRMDFTINPSLACVDSNATCGRTAESLDSARYSKSCVDVPKLPSVYLKSDAVPLVVFNQYADTDTKCSPSSLVGGTQYPIDTCVAAHSETGFQTFEGRQIQSEYVSANMSNGQLIRSFFSDNNCTNYLSAVSFDNKLAACDSHMSATIINPLIFRRLVFYRDDACTLTNTVRYLVSNKDKCVASSFCGKGNAFPQQDSCVNTPTLAADATMYFKNNPYVIYDYYQDDNCQGFMRSTAVAMNVCRLIVGNQSSNITVMPDGSFVATTYNAPDCKNGVNSTIKYAGNGACTLSVRMTAYNYASLLRPSGVVTGDSNTSSSQSSSSSNNVGGIIGGIVGAVVVLGAIGGFLFMRNKKKHATAKQLSTTSLPSNYGPSGDAPLLPPPGPNNSAFEQTSAASAGVSKTVQGDSNQFAVVAAPIFYDAVRRAYYSQSEVSSSVGQSEESIVGDNNQTQGPLPHKATLMSNNNNQSFLNESLASAASSTTVATAATLYPIQIGKVTLPINPSTWSVADTALWIVENGGSSDSARLVKEQEVDGRTLLKAKVSELADALEIRTLGQRVRFEEGIEGLKAVAAKVGAAAGVSTEGGDAPPPAYFMTA
ncbi:hypothetical protein HDU81_001582 [Chytriomyces hyalinus]|nr:hypothetical protein HDU81_001582 [Chytriomyces hyalinus]